MQMLNGWRLFWTATAGLLIMATIMLVTANVTSDGIRLVIRATARTSLLLFLAAFMASTMTRLAPGRFSSWLRSNRRYLGLSFAMSHFIHLCAIIALARLYPDIFWGLSNERTIFNGSFGYLAIALLAATSFDWSVRWLGVKNWQRLHTVGSWFIWLSFVFTNGKRIPGNLWYAVPVAILFAALIAKIYAKRRGTMTVSSVSSAISG